MANTTPIKLSTYREYLLNVNEFNKPEIQVDHNALALLLTRLILLEPGTNPLFPTMGVGIVSKYRFLMQDQEANLINDIKEQANKFLPGSKCTNVNLIYNDDKTINIEITVDDTVFVYDSTELIPITLADMKDEE